MEYVGKAVFYGLQAYHSIAGCLQRFLPESIEYASDWKLCNPTTREIFTGETREEFCMDDEFPFLLHQVRRKRAGLHEEFRTAVHWYDHHRPPYLQKDLFEPLVTAPWLFIGFRDGEDTVDCTDELSQYICYGNFIDTRLLNFLVPRAKDKPWVYIHPKTFNETEFPSEGMIIDDEYESEEDGTGGTGDDAADSPADKKND